MATGPPPLNIVTKSRYEKDAKRLRKRGNDMVLLLAVVDEIRNRRPLAERHRDHGLSGDWEGWRDCHITPDWILIYQVDEDAGELVLGRTGTHSDLF